MSKQKRDRLGRWAGTRSALTGGQRKLMLAPHKEALRSAKDAHAKAELEHAAALAKPRDKKAHSPHGHKTDQARWRAAAAVETAHDKLRAVRRGAGSSSSVIGAKKALTDQEAAKKHKEITARPALDRDARAKALGPAKEAVRRNREAADAASEETGHPELDRNARKAALAPAKEAYSKATKAHEAAAAQDRVARAKALTPHKEAYGAAKAKWQAVLNDPSGPKLSERAQHEKMRDNITSTREALRQARREAGRGGSADATRTARREARQALRETRRKVGESKGVRLASVLLQSEEALKEKRREVGRSNRAERYGRWATK